MTRILMAAALICAALVPASASAAETTVSCNVYGPGAVGYDYKTIVKGAFTLNLDEIVLDPKSSVNSCVEVGRKSRTFGAVGGTRLELAAMKCHTNDAYFTAKVQVAGLTIVSHIKGPISRFTLNDDTTGNNIVTDPSGALPPSAPIVIREGTFRFIYVDCSIK